MEYYLEVLDSIFIYILEKSIWIRILKTIPLFYLNTYRYTDYRWKSIHNMFDL